MDQKYGEFVGVDSLFYAKILADTLAAYTAGTPTFLAPAAEVAGSPKVAVKTTYYDNKPGNVYTTEGETEVKVVISNVPAPIAADLLGKYYDVASGRVYDIGEAKPPYVALGFRYNMGEDDYRHFWYLKGKFSAGSEEAKSKSGDVDPKTYELTFTALTTVHLWNINGAPKSLKRVYGDTADSAFNPTDWFSQVQTPDTVSAPSTLALSSIVPADDATGVAVGAVIVLTFNNKIAAESITLISAAGVVVAITKTFDTTGKILTLTPSSNLSASTAYIVSIAGVVDIYGKALAAVAMNFTTAA